MHHTAGRNTRLLVFQPRLAHQDDCLAGSLCCPAHPPCVFQLAPTLPLPELLTFRAVLCPWETKQPHAAGIRDPVIVSDSRLPHSWLTCAGSFGGRHQWANSAYLSSSCFSPCRAAPSRLSELSIVWGHRQQVVATHSPGSIGPSKLSGAAPSPLPVKGWREAAPCMS